MKASRVEEESEESARSAVSRCVPLLHSLVAATMAPTASRGMAFDGVAAIERMRSHCEPRSAVCGVSQTVVDVAKLMRSRHTAAFAAFDARRAQQVEADRQRRDMRAMDGAVKLTEGEQQLQRMAAQLAELTPQLQLALDAVAHEVPPGEQVGSALAKARAEQAASKSEEQEDGLVWEDELGIAFEAEPAAAAKAAAPSDKSSRLLAAEELARELCDSLCA
jgi:hypothetical protein